MRILKRADFSETEILSYDKGYRFSEAKVSPTGDTVIFYSYTGLRIYSIEGGLTAETAFPDPYFVLNTEYDKASGNVAVMYESAFRLYSGTDGSMLVEAYGKSGVKSVFYTTFGVSVLDENDTVTLYDLATGEAAATARVNPEADYAVILGDLLLESVAGVVHFGESSMAGELIGAAKTDAGYAFAISDGIAGKVFTANAGGRFSERFTFDVRGRAEAYFSGGYVFISPWHGDAAAYILEGKLVRTFSENGYLAETSELEGYITADYVTSSSERYSLLLEPDSLETVALLHGFLGFTDSGALILDDRAGSLRKARLYSTAELIEMARERLNGRKLTPDEIKTFKAG